MGKKGMRTYQSEGGERLEFDFDAFRDAFKLRAKEDQVSQKRLEPMLGDAVGVADSTVHSWLMAKSAPSDERLVADIASFLNVPKGVLLTKTKEEIMATENVTPETQEEPRKERLSERQLDAVARVYREVSDFIRLYEYTDGFVWTNYVLLPGTEQAKYMPARTIFSLDEGRMVYKDGVDLAIDASAWVLHCLEREWVYLGDHPIYEELWEYIQGPMDAMWEGKTDPDYYFEPPSEGESWDDHSKEVLMVRAYKQIREIISKYV